MTRLVAVACLLVAAGGCAAPPMIIASAGASAVEMGAGAWFSGRLEAAEYASLDKIHAAAMRALQDLEFTVTDDRLYPARSFINARGMFGSSVAVRANAITPQLTKLKIRVGVLGDQPVSVLIHQRIKENLAPKPEEPAR